MGYSNSHANLSNPREGYAALGVRALGLEQQQTLMPLPLGVAVPLRVSLGRGEERATNKTNPLLCNAFDNARNLARVEFREREALLAEVFERRAEEIEPLVIND